MAAHKRPAQIFVNFSAGGVPAGITEAVFADHIEKQTGFAFSDLVDGCHSASAGTPIAVPLFARHRDDPAKPAFSAEATLDLFRENSQNWLRRQISYLPQHLKSIFDRSAKGIYIDEQLIEATLEKHLGGLTLSGMRKSFAISAHNGMAAHPGRTAVMFSKMDLPDGSTTYSHSPDIRLNDIMRGSMAVPGHFKSKRIEGIGDFSDFGHIYSGQRAFFRFQRQQPADADIHFIEIGGPRYGSLHPDRVNRCSLLGLIMNGHLIQNTSDHSYSSGLQSIEESIGPDRIHDLTPIIDGRSIALKTNPSRNILDASARNIALIEDFAHDMARRDEGLKKLCDFLGENKISRDAAGSEPVQLVAAQKTYPGFMATMRSMLHIGGSSSGSHPAPAPVLP